MSETEKKIEDQPEEEKKDDLAFFDDFSFIKPQKFVTNKPKTDTAESIPPYQER